MSVGEQVCCCLKWKQLKQPHSRDSLSGENLSMFQIGLPVQGSQLVKSVNATGTPSFTSALGAGALLDLLD